MLRSLEEEFVWSGLRVPAPIVEYRFPRQKHIALRLFNLSLFILSPAQRFGLG